MVVYRFADVSIAFDASIVNMEAYRQKGPEQAAQLPPVPSDSAPIRQLTEGIVAGALREITCQADGHGMHLMCEGVTFHVLEGGTVIRRHDGSRTASAFEREFLLGPVLVLALAAQGVWSLHASAVQHAGKLFAFVGDSGQGKSTTAAFLSAFPGWRRVADDILPIIPDGQRIAACPHFPQLKLPDPAAPAQGLPGSMPLEAVFVLRPVPPGQPPARTRLARRPAAEALLRHTAGTRLFPPDLLGRHLAFCAQAAGDLPVFALDYPRTPQSLPALRALLEEA